MNRVPSTTTCLKLSPLVDTFFPDGSAASVRWLSTNVFPLSKRPSTATTAPSHDGPAGGAERSLSASLSASDAPSPTPPRTACASESSIDLRNASEYRTFQPSVLTSDSLLISHTQSYTSEKSTGSLRSRFSRRFAWMPERSAVFCACSSRCRSRSSSPSRRASSSIACVSASHRAAVSSFASAASKPSHSGSGQTGTASAGGGADDGPASEEDAGAASSSGGGSSCNSGLSIDRGVRSANRDRRAHLASELVRFTACGGRRRTDAQRDALRVPRRNFRRRRRAKFAVEPSPQPVAHLRTVAAALPHRSLHTGQRGQRRLCRRDRAVDVRARGGDGPAAGGARPRRAAEPRGQGARHAGVDALRAAPRE